MWQSLANLPQHRIDDGLVALILVAIVTEHTNNWCIRQLQIRKFKRRVLHVAWSDRSIMSCSFVLGQGPVNLILSKGDRRANR